jgi:hypothetical protein
VIRKTFNPELHPEIFWSPFEMLNLIFTVNVQNIKVSEKIIEGKSGIIKFNCMDTKEGKISFANGCKYGKYDLA